MSNIDTCQFQQIEIDNQAPGTRSIGVQYIADKPAPIQVSVGQYETRDVYQQCAKQFDENVLYGNPKAAEIWHERIHMLADDAEALRNSLGLEDEIACDELMRPLMLLNATGRYAEAVQYGKNARVRLGDRFDVSRPYFQTAAAELDVYYAQALAYTGQTDTALHLLRRVAAELDVVHDPDVDLGQYPELRRRRVLGRAHNNLGHILESEDQLLEARREFWIALAYFPVSELGEEWANTHDNLGRTYVRLCDPEHAWEHLDQSWIMRESLGWPHCLALSLTSRSNAYHEFGHGQRAEKLAWEALMLFRQVGSRRGIGLACIALARALRRVCEERRMSSQERMFRLDEAERYLRQAISIFEHEVCEPIRLAEAYDELVGTSRDKMATCWIDSTAVETARSAA